MYDMKNLTRLKHLEIHMPEATKAFWAFGKAAWSEGAIPKKHKELIAVAVALTIQCPIASISMLGERERPERRNRRSPKPCSPLPRCARPERSRTARMA